MADVMWNVMGARPGDGSTQAADSPEKALMQHVLLDFADDDKPTAEEVDIELAAFRKQKVECENGKRFVIGDYEVIKLSQ